MDHQKNMASDLRLTVQLHEDDNVALAIKSLNIGTSLDGIAVQENIPTGHKVAIHPISRGTQITKYGQIIGYAKSNILPGQHVHTHNVEFRPSNPVHSVGEGIKQFEVCSDSEKRFFQGFKRDNGQTGTRNFIAVLTSVNCSANAAKNIADFFDTEQLKRYPNIDGVVSFTHSSGCAMDAEGEGYRVLQRVLWGYARHPNFGGVLMVGLGCETNQIHDLLANYQLSESSLFKVINIQNQGGLRKTIQNGIECIGDMVHQVNEQQRTPCPVSDLKLGLQCGGSDAWSGLTANPALGYCADLLIQQGGTAVLSETPEIYGAEHLLTRRARNSDVAQKLMQRIEWWQDYTRRNQGSMDNNPSHGNKKGGLTTILEKSLGAVAKSGTMPLEQVYEYAEPIDTTGFVLMDSPGYDPTSITGQIASGCNVVAFTTGRGSVYGSKPAPCIKVATNSAMYSRMTEDMDINAGKILDSESDIQTVGKEIFELVIDVASGKPSLSEAQGLGDLEFIPWQIGAVM